MVDGIWDGTTPITTVHLTITICPILQQQVKICSVIGWGTLPTGLSMHSVLTILCPQTGDARRTDMERGLMFASYQAKYHHDPYAMWYIQQTAHLGQWRDAVINFLFEPDNTLQPKSPSNLPLSRYFQKSGTVVARDSWNFQNATLFIFKSSPFYSSGHHHRDENSFTIDYKTSLALDSGVYDEFGTPHYKNYYSRTIAHNAITVLNPQQQYYFITDATKSIPLQKLKISNDGGQIFQPGSDSRTLEDILPNGRHALTGITHYYNDNNITYTRGDATKAYDTQTVTLAQRDAIFIKKGSGFQHAVTIIIDKIESTDSSFQKRYLLHMESSNAPQIIGNVMSYDTIVPRSNGQKVKLLNFTLYPIDATLKIVGGANHEFALYDEQNNLESQTQIKSNGMPVDIVSNPHNNTDINQSVEYWRTHLDEMETKVGNYRLEVSPQKGKKYDILINLLFVGDENERIDTSTISKFENNQTIGFNIASNAYIILKDKNESAVTSFTYTPTSDITQHTIISGFKKGDLITIYKNNTQIQNSILKEDGIIKFNLITKPGDHIRIQK